MEEEIVDHSMYHFELTRRQQFKDDIVFDDIRDSFANRRASLDHKCLGVGRDGKQCARKVEATHQRMAQKLLRKGPDSISSDLQHLVIHLLCSDHRQYEPLVSKISTRLLLSMQDLPDRYSPHRPFNVSCDCWYESHGGTELYFVTEDVEYTYETDVVQHPNYLAAQAGWTGEYAALASGSEFGNVVHDDYSEIPSSWSYRRYPQVRRRTGRKTRRPVNPLLEYVQQGATVIHGVEGSSYPLQLRPHSDTTGTVSTNANLVTDPQEDSNTAHQSDVHQEDTNDPETIEMDGYWSNQSQSGVMTEILSTTGSPTGAAHSFGKLLRRVPGCWFLIAFGILFFCGSLAVSLYFSIVKDKTGDGFTTGSYILAVGAFVLGGPVAKHYAHCNCWVSTSSTIRRA